MCFGSHHFKTPITKKYLIILIFIDIFLIGLVFLMAEFNSAQKSRRWIQTLV